MHELWLCKNIVNIVNNKMRDIQNKRVKKIVIAAGELLAIDIAALQFSFSVISDGTFMSGAALEVIVIPGQATCQYCHKVLNVKSYLDVCQYCYQGNLVIIRGEELVVKHMEVE